jgi:hypothetical protein
MIEGKMPAKQFYTWLGHLALLALVYYIGGWQERGNTVKIAEKCSNSLIKIIREEQDLGDMLQETHDNLEQCSRDLEDARGPKGF